MKRKTYPVAHVRDHTFEQREAAWRAKLGLSAECPRNVKQRECSLNALHVLLFVIVVIATFAVFVHYVS